MTLTQGVLNNQNEQRDFIDLLRSRLRLLSGKDRLLMTMYLEKGNSYRQLALQPASTKETSPEGLEKLPNGL